MGKVFDFRTGEELTQKQIDTLPIIEYKGKPAIPVGDVVQHDDLDVSGVPANQAPINPAYANLLGTGVLKNYFDRGPQDAS